MASHTSPSPPPFNSIRLVCISDTHNRTFPVPPGDILVHAGDLTNNGTPKELQAQINWLDTQPHRYKVAIAGNHDAFIDPVSRVTLSKEDQEKFVDWKSLIYLQFESHTLHFPEKDREISVFGAPQVPHCGGSSFAFQYKRHLHPWKDAIPKRIDVLVTHTPPKYYHDNPAGDFVSTGCAGLLNEVSKVQPKIHVFGHVHNGRGMSVVQWGCRQRAYGRTCERVNGGLLEILNVWAWIHLWCVALSGFGMVARDCLGWKRSSKETVMVNAAIWYDRETDLPDSIHVIDI